MDIGIKIRNIEFKNPVFSASGTFGFGEEYSGVFNINMLGAVITKGLTLHPREGNDGLRIKEVPCGIINRIGLQNPGIEKFIAEKLPFLNKLKTKIIINIAGFSIQEFLEIIGHLDKYDSLCGYEINVSCPNVEKGGIEFCSDIQLFTELMQKIRKKTDKLLIIKLPPSAYSFIELARIAEQYEMDAVTAANTYKSAFIDIEKKELMIKGGLSGPAIFPVTLNLVLEVKKNIKIPVIASGGIYNSDTAVQYLLAGAEALQIGTFQFIDPLISLKIIKDIENYLKKNKMNSLSSITGKVKL